MIVPKEDIEINREVENESVDSEKRGRGRPKGSINTTNTEIQELKDMIKSLTVALTNTNEKIAKIEQNTIIQNNNTHTPQNSNTQLQSYKNYTKLPKQELPKFNGSLIDFDSFWQIFNYAVDNSNIPPANKLLYLLSCLENTPKNIIRQLPIVNESYYIAKEILTKEYALHQKLQTFPHCNDTLNDLRKFVDQIEQILLHMQQATNIDVLGILVIIEQKLPKWLVEKLVILELEKPNLKVEEIIDCMRSALRVKEFL